MTERRTTTDFNLLRRRLETERKRLMEERERLKTNIRPDERWEGGPHGEEGELAKGRDIGFAEYVQNFLLLL